MMKPFTWPGGVPTTVRRQSHRDSQRAASPKMERWDVFQESLKRESVRSLWQRFQIWCDKLGRTISRQTTLILTKKPHVICLMSSGIWDFTCQPLRLSDLWNPRGLARAGQLAVCQWCFEDLTKGSVVFPSHITFGIAQGHRPDRCS